MPAANGKVPRRSRLRPARLGYSVGHCQSVCQLVLGSPGRGAKLRAFTTLEPFPHTGQRCPSAVEDP